jgi:antitoxin (DNA-binding transcriptional repressor) of toxin-antitoxin stability system
MSEAVVNIVNMHAAKTQLSKLVARAEKGERIIIARAGKAVAELGPAPRDKRRPAPVDDPLLRLDEWGFDGPVGAMTNLEIDRIVYGI